MATFFKQCKTLEDVKNTYKDLYLAHGHNSAVMAEIASEYQTAFVALADQFKNAKGVIYTAKDKKTGTPKEWADMVQALAKMDGLKIELCGTWLWVTGNTYAHKKGLHDLAFKYHKEKKAWSYHNEPYRKKGKKKLSLAEIRTAYGTTKLNDEDRD
jgi:hypothetical protein